MTSRLRGSSKDETKPVSLLSSKSRTYLGSGRESRDKSNVEVSRNKVSRKDSRVGGGGGGGGGGKYENFQEINEDKRNVNGFHDVELDPDILYRRSRDQFGSWNIQDIISENDETLNGDDKRSKTHRKSRFDMFKSNGSHQDGKKLANGNVRSKHGSPEFEETDFNEKKIGSPDHDRSYKFKLNKKNSHDKSRRKSPTKEIDGTNFITRAYRDTEEKEDHRLMKKNRSLLQEIENFRSNRRGLTKSNDSPERENEKLQNSIDGFRNNEDDAEESFKTRDYRRRVSPSNENRMKMRNADGFASSKDNKKSNEIDEDDDEERRVAGWTTNRNWKETNDQSLDRKFVRKNVIDNKSVERTIKQRRNGDTALQHENGFRKRSDTYSVERGIRQNDLHDEESKRRSYVYSGSPDRFDVQIQKYERALNGPRKDAELSSGKTEVKRRSSMKIKEDLNEPREKEKRNGRHNRPLTPPDYDGHKFQEKRSNFDTKNWYESNKQFAVKYLRDNSKISHASSNGDDGKEEVLDGKPIREQKKETYFGDRRMNLPNDEAEDFRHKVNTSSSSFKKETNELNERDEEWDDRKLLARRNLIKIDGGGGGGGFDSGKRNRGGERGGGISEPITIKIRNVLEDDDNSENEIRTKRTVFHNDKEGEINSRIIMSKRYDDNDSPKKITGDARRIKDKDWTSVSTPARKIWNYRDGGAQITDVDDGQPCLKCGDTCSGFLQHPWRKNCHSCKCPREAHDVCHEEWVSVRSRLGLKGDGASGSVACDPREMGLTWAPPGLPSHKVEEYFSMLPELSVPRIGTPGERYRDRQLALQLPKQDLAKAYCRHLAPEHYTSADDFMAARNEIALDIGTVQEVLESGTSCAGCNESLKYGSLVVSAGKLGELYHPPCFQCVQCKELLVDLAYCVYNDAVYCERHYAERLKGRCAACDELIFSGEFTKAMNKDWHSGHFCCWQCDESLTGQRYVLRDEHPYCIKCYESVFANGCEECSKIIGIDSKDLSYKDKHWHEACFLCNKCRVSLVDKQFGSKVDKIYCGNCYDAQFASRCDGCGEIFRAGTKKMEYKTRQWHEKCFCCVVCKNAIGTKSFIPREQEIYCAGCYEDKFATRCVKCNKIITSGGVTYKNEPWHRECFTCSSCSTSLAGQRFTSRDEKPYCADCFGELFAKRCTACTKPITGIGGTRFISFEDRHWHNDCFICAGCKTSLVGRGFITDADDIICPECAKQKLM